MDTQGILFQLFLAVLLVASLILPSQESVETGDAGAEDISPELAFFNEA